MWRRCRTSRTALPCWCAPLHPPICHIYRVARLFRTRARVLACKLYGIFGAGAGRQPPSVVHSHGASVLLALELAQAGVQAAGGRLQAGLQRPADGPGVQGAVLGLI